MNAKQRQLNFKSQQPTCDLATMRSGAAVFLTGYFWLCLHRRPSNKKSLSNREAMKTAASSSSRRLQLSAACLSAGGAGSSPASFSNIEILNSINSSPSTRLCFSRAAAADRWPEHHSARHQQTGNHWFYQWLVTRLQQEQVGASGRKSCRHSKNTLGRGIELATLKTGSSEE